MRFYANKLVSVNLSGIIPYANQELIPSPLANSFLVRFRRFNANFKNFHSGFPISMVKISIKKLDGDPASFSQKKAPNYPWTK